MLFVCLRSMMLLAFTAHSVFGCCIHHLHAWNHCHDLLATLIAAPHSEPRTLACCCHRVPSAPKIIQRDAPVPEQPEPSEACDESFCYYLPTDSASTRLDVIQASLASVSFGSVVHRSCDIEPMTVMLQACNEHRLSLPPGALCSIHSSWQL